MYVCSYRVSGKNTVAFINTRSEMKSFYEGLLTCPSVSDIQVDIRTVSVDFGDGRLYTYLAHKNYRPGTMLNVPTRFGTKKAMVRSCNLKTKAALTEEAESHGFKFSDYKIAD